jgi:hypothetical protein
MAKRKTGPSKMPASPPVGRHARIELPDPDYKRLKKAASARGLSIAAYIRQAVLMQIRRDEKDEVGE